MAKKSDDDKLSEILKTVTEHRIDTAGWSKELETLATNTTQLFLRTEQHGERIAKVEVQAENTDETLTRHVSDKLIHNGSSPHLSAQNGSWSTKQKAAAIGGGAGVGTGLFYVIAKLFELIGAN